MKIEIELSEMLMRRLIDLARRLRRTPSELVQDALAPVLGLGGVPLDDSAAYGQSGEK